MKLGTSGSSTWMQQRSMTSRTIGDHHWVGTMIEMAIEFLPVKKVRSDFKIRELHGKIMHGWEKERKDAPILESGAESQVIVCCREPEGCGFVYEDDFIFGEELMSTAWMEVETNNEKMILMKNTDGDDRSVTVLSRLAMWKSEIRVDSRQILVAKMNLDGASTMSAANTAAKAQEKLDKETAMFRRATMGVSYISSDCANVQRAMDEMSRTMLESSEGACSIECSIWDVKESRLDAKNDQVECAFTGQSMMKVHVFTMSIYPKLEV